MQECYQCGAILDEDGECPCGCTENEDYYFGVGYYSDPQDLEEIDLEECTQDEVGIIKDILGK